MDSINCSIEGVKIIEPSVFQDKRGFFFESYNEDRYKEIAEINYHFVQDNHSKSSYGVLRGLHFQKNKPQGKLVRVIQGSVYDFFVDSRKDSLTFGQSHGIEINEKNKLQVWLPPGIDHGFLTLTPYAEFEYKCTDYYDPSDEESILWNDPNLNISWPIDDPQLSEKDTNASILADLKL